MATEINAGRVAMVPKGEWSASTAYVRLDVVQYNGSSYVCKQDGTGQNPSTATTYWQLLASGIDPSNYYTKTETNTKLGSKQDALVSGQNIKSINGQSVLGAGNLELGELFVVKMTRNNSNSVYTADKSVSEIYAASYTNGKPVIAVMRDINTPIFILADCDPDGDSYVFSSIESNSVTTLRWQRTDDYTYELETIALQPHLVSGTNIKTVNSTSLLGSGNVSINGVTNASAPVTADGTWQITLTNGDTITIDLNHEHPQYLKYELVQSLPTSPDSGTLYLIAAE